MAIDFGNFLPAGVTLTGTPTIALSVSYGTDAAPQSRLVGGPVVGTARDGTGIANTAIVFQIGSCVAGTIYVIDAYCLRSDGDTAEASAHFQCLAPG